MNHQIETKDIEEPMKQEIALASSYNSRAGTGKTLNFTPYDTTYRVRFNDKNSETSNSFRHPWDAVNQYNAHIV